MIIHCVNKREDQFLFRLEESFGQSYTNQLSNSNDTSTFLQKKSFIVTNLELNLNEND